MLSAALIAFVLVALAELGDKSQLLLVGFAARYRPVKVLAGAAIAVFALQLVAVLFGRAVGALVPMRFVAVAAGLLFIGFGVMTWRGSGDGSVDEEARPVARLGPVLTVAAAFFLAEFGDKTQLVTVSIAADPAAALRALGSLAPGVVPPDAGAVTTAVGVWLGSALGMLAADAVAIVVGAMIGTRLPAHLIGRFSAVVFVLFGLVTFASAFVGG
ncbi:MAG: TMEM165/GDT1 family protein [Coriobacteriia bacterium]|nr:TMEM165/GDT1 family protein [Coriobacteriia bacterium]